MIDLLSFLIFFALYTLSTCILFRKKSMSFAPAEFQPTNPISFFQLRGNVGCDLIIFASHVESNYINERGEGEKRFRMRICSDRDRDISAERKDGKDEPAAGCREEVYQKREIRLVFHVEVGKFRIASAWCLILRVCNFICLVNFQQNEAIETE